jgi:hypothetical protein
MTLLPGLAIPVVQSNTELPVTAKPDAVRHAVAGAFVENMNDYFAESDQIKRDALAAHQLSVLQPYQGPREKEAAVVGCEGEMFRQMRDHA